MQFKYILYLIFLSLFACEHHSSNINIKNKPEETKSIVQKKEIKEVEKIEKEELVNIVYSNKGFALINSENSNNINEFNSVKFDHIITVCDNAQEKCPIFFSENAIRTHHPFFDPSSIKNPKLIESAFAKCRDEIKLFCKDFLEKNFS